MSPEEAQERLEQIGRELHDVHVALAAEREAITAAVQERTIVRLVAALRQRAEGIRREIGPLAYEPSAIRVEIASELLRLADEIERGGS